MAIAAGLAVTLDVKLAVQRAIVDGDAVRAQRGGELSHGRQKHRDARLRHPDFGRLVRRLGPPHDVSARVEAIERRAAPVELVAENEDQVTHAGLVEEGTLPFERKGSVPSRL